jgi:hypothetical protein
MSRPDLLFSSGDLSDALRGRERELAQAAETISPDHALARSAEELTAELVEHFRIEPLVLDWESKTASIEDAKVDVSGDFRRGILPGEGPVWIAGSRLTFRVLFTGERDLVKYRPSHSTFNPPRGIVGNHDLRLVATAPVDQREGLAAALEAEIAKIEIYVGHVNADVESFNKHLEGTARQHVEQRRAKVIGDRELVAKLGVQVEKREDAAPTYAVAPARRPVTEVRGHKPNAPEPVLRAEVYEQILDIAQGMSVAMERSPSTFARLNEEALRDFFLVSLNGQYQGGATGETFNFEGKTDILIREKGRNVFIAECKFWDGPAKLAATVDQLLGYTSWRDTQTAIFIFNRRRSLTQVMSAISPTIASHAAFVREIPYRGETERRFVLRHRDDPERELTLTVLVFEVPGAPR